MLGMCSHSLKRIMGSQLYMTMIQTVEKEMKGKALELSIKPREVNSRCLGSSQEQPIAAWLKNPIVLKFQLQHQLNHVNLNQAHFKHRKISVVAI